MNKIIKILSSRTVITVVFMVVTNIVAVLPGVISSDLLALLNTVLGALAVYFRISPGVKF